MKNTGIEKQLDVVVRFRTMKISRIKRASLATLVRLFCIVCCVLLWSDNCTTNIAEARPLNSIQLATGEWDVSIRGGYWMNASRIFPSVSESPKPTTFAELADGSENNKKSGGVKPFVRRRPWGSSIDCILSIASDGTFVLTPKYVEARGPGDNPFSKEKEEYKTRNCDWTPKTKEIDEGTKDGLLDIRGSWNVMSNPYCVTDRFYDQVSLLSYPRQKIETVEGRESIGATKENVVESFQFTMNCRMWGRHNRQSTRRYRMTHGTLVYKAHHRPWWKQFGRPVMGSFSAVRSSYKPKHEGWIDKERFGYSTD